MLVPEGGVPVAAERTAPAGLMPPNEAGGAVRLDKGEARAFQNGWGYGSGPGQQSYGSSVNRPWSNG